MSTTASTHRRVALVAALGIAALATAGPIWFDPSEGGARHASFASLVAEYRSFLGTPDGTIDFTSLPGGVPLGTQYRAAHGVTFSNTNGGPFSAYSGKQIEGGAIAEHITGYDGSYRPDGDSVYVRFSNDLNPFTIVFDEPVATVGAFVGMGVQGSVHSLTVRAYDRGGALLGSQLYESWLWESSATTQNYESFVALRSPSADIARLEIMNNARTNFANALIIDDIAYSRWVPEPATLVLLLTGVALVSRSAARRLTWRVIQA